MTGWKAQCPGAALDDESFELVAATCGSGAPRAMQSRATQREIKMEHSVAEPQPKPGRVRLRRTHFRFVIALIPECWLQN